MTVTACGRWALNLTAADIMSLGLDVLHGDANSVMFTLQGNSNSINTSLFDYRYKETKLKGTLTKAKGEIGRQE